MSDNQQFPMNLFVYGTLMKGFSNHHYMKSCTYLGKAKTIHKYAMFSTDFPFVTNKQADVEIIGEVYSVPNKDILLPIDELEDHPQEYERKPIPVMLIDSQTTIEAQLYFKEIVDLDQPDLESISSGSFLDYKYVDQYRVSENNNEEVGK